jgi:nicotinate phosphoribosyltransferase
MSAQVGAGCALTPERVRGVRRALDQAGFEHVKIVVTDDFTPERIRAFEEADVPVDAYAVGQYLLRGEFAYYADVVAVDGRPCARAGLQHRPNPRLSPVE